MSFTSLQVFLLVASSTIDCISWVLLSGRRHHRLYQLGAGVRASMDDAWDLEMELLCLPATGGSVKSTQRLSSRISKACVGTPRHVMELGQLTTGSHRERQLCRWVRRQPWRQLLPEAYEFKLPYSPDQLIEDEVTHAAFLPHETFSSLSEYPELFEELMTGPRGHLEAFWEGTSSTSWYKKHPVPELHAAPHLAVPIGIHGDEGGVYGSGEQVLVITWCSCARDLLTLDSRILFAAVLCNHRVPMKTNETLYKVLRWSLNCLAEGKFPHADHEGKEFSPQYHPARFTKAGKPLTSNNMRGIWSELRGDWKWQVEALHLDQWYNTKFCCHLCRAHTKIKRLWYTQFSQNAPFRHRTRVSTSKFRDWYICRLIRPALLDIIGFDIWRCWPDAMHILDLGVYQSVAGSCLFELVLEGVWTYTDDAGFKAAHVQYKKWCTKHRLEPCPMFDQGQLRRSATEYPEFGQQSAKANMIKHIMYWLRDVLSQPGVSAGPHGCCRRSMVEAFCAVEDVLANHGRFLPITSREAVADHMERALIHMNYLHCEALEKKEFFWHIPTKCHMATHLAYDFVAEGVNPRRVTCYADEDMVGRVKRIVQRCHGAKAGTRVLDRYAILVGTRWWTRLAQLRGLRQPT